MLYQAIDAFLDKWLGPSWHTSVLGVAMIIGAIIDLVIAFASDKSPNWQADWTAVTGGIGLIFAKDKGVSNAGNPVPARAVDPQPPLVDHE